MRKHTVLFLLLALLNISSAMAQSSWYTPLNFGLIPMAAGGGRYDDIFFTSHDTGVLVSSYGMIFKTYDGAQHWHLKKAITASVYFRSVEFSADGQVGIAGTVSGFVYRSTDRGETWNDISASIADTGTDARRICGLGHSGNTFYGVGWWGGTVARFYKSTDAGVTWTTHYIDTSLATGLVDIVFLTPDKGFITGCKGYSYSDPRKSVVLRTLDGGNTWTKVFSDTTIGGRIWKIQFLDSTWGVGSIEPMYKDTVAMIKTTDGGNTWQIHAAGHTNGWTNYYGTQGIGFVNKLQGWMGGYYNGMFQTNDGGLTWDTLNINEECDRFFLIDSTIYLSSNTVHKYGPASTEAVAPVAAPVYVHKLYPISPNPAQGDVHIEFDINQHQTNVLLEVINTDGRKIYPIANAYLRPGHYSYDWNSSTAPDGNYIIWLGTDEIPMTQKFVLHKR